MNRNIILKNIQDFGYTENEAKLYLTALETGTSPASILAEKSDLNRVTAYGTCQKLLKKGLFTVSEIKEIQHFTAIDPDIFFAEQKNKMDQLSATLPILKSLTTDANEKPVVRYFEGIEGLKNAYEITLNAQTEILNYANSRNIRDHWKEYDTDYVTRRAENKIFLRGIAPDDAHGRRVQGNDTLFFRETKLKPKKLFWVENEIKIFDDKVLIVSFDPHPFAILMQSQTVAETQKQIFNLAWN